MKPRRNTSNAFAKNVLPSHIPNVKRGKIMSEKKPKPKNNNTLFYKPATVQDKWVIFDKSGTRVAVFLFKEKLQAENKLKELINTQGSGFYINLVTE